MTPKERKELQNLIASVTGGIQIIPIIAEEKPSIARNANTRDAFAGYAPIFNFRIPGSRKSMNERW